MFHTSGHYAVLGGRKDSTWDRSYTVRKAQKFHAPIFDERLLDNIQNTKHLVDKFLEGEGEDALDPHGPSKVSLERYLSTANFAVLESTTPMAASARKLAIFDDRREREDFQDAMRNWNDPDYQTGVAGVRADYKAVNEQELYRKLKEKVSRDVICKQRSQQADSFSGETIDLSDVLCRHKTLALKYSCRWLTLLVLYLTRRI